MMDTGSLIRCRRLELGMTQEELGNKIGVKKQAVCKYETGRIDLKRDMIKKLATALEVSPSYLLGMRGDDVEEVKNFDIGKKIRSLRESAGLSQKDFAQKLDISPARLSNWELGINRPDADMIKTICEKTGVSANDLLGVHAVSAYLPSIEEAEILRKYRTLDEHGKEMVDFVLEKEAERVAAEVAPQAKMYHIKIAGFDGSFEEKDITEEEADAIRNLPEFTEKI